MTLGTAAVAHGSQEKGRAVPSAPNRGTAPRQRPEGRREPGREKRVLALAHHVTGSFLAYPKLSLHLRHCDLKDIVTERYPCSQKDLVKDFMFYLRSYPHRKHPLLILLQNTLQYFTE